MKTYDPSKFKNQMDSLHYEDQIKKLFGNEVLLVYNRPYLKKNITPRQELISKIFSVVSLWYLIFLIDEKPTTIVDIGCGENLFKPIIKKIFDINVYGIDPLPNNQSADEFDFFDLDFSRGHANMYSSVFSINALHFIPLDYFTTRVVEFYNVVSVGGMGFLAMNSARMIERSDKQWLVDTFNNDCPTQNQIENYINNELSKIDINFIVKDVLIGQFQDECLDGNIRLVFKK